MIDLQKPIRTKDGREAKYLGELPDGRHVIASPASSRDGLVWLTDSYKTGDISRDFENIPPAPPKLTGYALALPHKIMGPFLTPEAAAKDMDTSHVLDLSTLTEKNFVRVGL